MKLLISISGNQSSNCACVTKPGCLTRKKKVPAAIKPVPSEGNMRHYIRAANLKASNLKWKQVPLFIVFLFLFFLIIIIIIIIKKRK